jgi:hypothetical protein
MDEASHPRAGGRRTVRISGQAARTTPRRRPAGPNGFAGRPDRLAFWAFLLGLLMIAMAALTAHA